MFNWINKFKLVKFCRLLKSKIFKSYEYYNQTDDESKLPWGTWFEMSGYADYFESIYEDGDG